MITTTIQVEMLTSNKICILPEHNPILERRRSSRIKGGAQGCSGARSITCWMEDVLRLEQALRRGDVVQCFLAASLSYTIDEDIKSG